MSCLHWGTQDDDVDWVCVRLGCIFLVVSAKTQYKTGVNGVIAIGIGTIITPIIFIVYKTHFLPPIRIIYPGSQPWVFQEVHSSTNHPSSTPYNNRQP